MFIHELQWPPNFVRFAKKTGADIKFKNTFSVFNGINGSENDLYVETDDCVYSIKLAGFLSSNKALCFCDPTHYSYKPYIKAVASANNASNRNDTYVLKEKKACDFNAFLPQNSSDKAVKPCYLAIPSPFIKASAVFGNSMKEIDSGDNIGEAYYYNLNGLIKELVHA